MNGFYWVIPNSLAGSGRPGYRGRSGTLEQLETDLVWLRQQGIEAIVSMTETALEAEIIARHGFKMIHLPVIDMTPPSPEQITAALAFIDEQRAQLRPVVVHCLMGQGRTGTILAAYLIRDGLSPERAVAELREVCPHAVENRDQEAALAAFAADRSWVI